MTKISSKQIETVAAEITALEVSGKTAQADRIQIEFANKFSTTAYNNLCRILWKTR